MNTQTAPPTPGPPNMPAVPPGWNAEWSVQYARYFFVNLATNESVWILPTIRPTLTQTAQSVQRKPVPTRGLELQAQASSSPQHLPHVQYSASPRSTIQQQDSPTQNYQNLSPPPTPGGSQQQYSHFPPSPQYHHPYQQNFTQSPTPASYNPQPCVPTPPVEDQRLGGDTRSARLNGYSVPPSAATNNADPPLHHQHNFAMPPQQHAYYPHQAYAYQPAPPPPQQHQQQVRGLSTFNSLSSNPTLKKWSSKLSQIQNRPSTTATTETARAASATPTPANGDWKKWTKRAAIGVAAVGALALGVDAIGDAGASAFGGGEFSGGGDWSGGGAEFGDAASVDASAAQIAMEQQGQENAQMLLDPPGTTYTVVDANSLI